MNHLLTGKVLLMSRMHLVNGRCPTAFRRLSVCPYLMGPCLVLLMLLLLASCDFPIHNPSAKPISISKSTSLDDGYHVLWVFLGDEQYLRMIRLSKAVLTLRRLSDASKQLVDDIASTSREAVKELNSLALLNPPLNLEESLPSMIGQETLDALRMTAVKELILTRDDFEIVLLVSQAQVLRGISHLAKELGEIDPNTTRQAWLDDLAVQIDHLYIRVIGRLALRPG